MGAEIRVYREKIKSTSSMKKIFKAMELIATARVGKARSRAQASTPYAEAITRAVAAVGAQGDIDHVLTQHVETPRRAAVLIMTSDRGLAGAYSANVIKASESLLARLSQDGVEARPYIYGRKVQQFYEFRNREYDKVWTGNTDNPSVETAREIGTTLVDRFSQDTEEGGVDELYLVYTHFESMVKQDPVVKRMLPLNVVTGESGRVPEYEFEPSPEEVLDELLPRYIESRIFSAMLEASASELAARQRAMKSAGDNANDLIRKYTLLRNNARQAEITQELSELIAGADALAAS